MHASQYLHPNELFAVLLSSSGRPMRQDNLQKIHQLCSRHYANGGRDFSRATIGRMAEAESIIKGRTLYNAPSADYVRLIRAWAAHAQT
jgi:hypothetical protein